MKTKLLFTVCLLAILAGCQTPISDLFKAQTATGRSLTVTSHIGAIGARTILPSGFPTPDTYSLVVHPEAGGTDITQPALGTVYGLSAQIYGITVTGFSGVNAIVTGTGSANLTTGSISLDIPLNYIKTGGTGSIYLTFNSSGVGVTSNSLTVVSPSGIRSSPTLTPSDGSYLYNNPTAETGSWTVMATFGNGTQTTTKAESVVVFQNVPTSATIRVTAADFLPLTGMVPIPGGTYQRSETSGDLTTVSPFLMGQYPVTRQEYLAVMGTDPSDPGVSFSNSLNEPVQMISKYRAIAYCNRLSLADGLTPVYTVWEAGIPIDFSTFTFAQIAAITDASWDAATVDWAANGYRLPTEAEYIWAAMGGIADSKTADVTGGVNTAGYLKGFAGDNGNNSIGDYVWYGANSENKIHPVGTKLPNEFGLYDMSGEVWQWVWDWYADYPSGARLNPKGPTSGSAGIVHGFGYFSSVGDSNFASRNTNPVSTLANTLGFRVVRSAQPLCSVTYLSNGATSGNVPIDTDLYPSGVTVTIPGNPGTLEKIGSEFSGWNTAADGTGTNYQSGDTVQVGPGPLVLYVKWTAVLVFLHDFPSVGTSPRPEGLAFDGTSLWVGEVNDSKVYKIDPADGSIQFSFNVASTHALAVDDSGELWTTSYWDDPPALFRYPNTGGTPNLTLTLGTAQTFPTAIAYDTTSMCLWMVNTNSAQPQRIWKVSAIDGSTLDSWDLGAQSLSTVYGLCVDYTDPQYLWMVEGNTLYKISITTKQVVEQDVIPSPANLLGGIAMVGPRTFWLVEMNNQRLLEVQLP